MNNDKRTSESEIYYRRKNQQWRVTQVLGFFLVICWLVYGFGGYDQLVIFLGAVGVLAVLVWILSKFV